MPKLVCADCGTFANTVVIRPGTRAGDFIAWVGFPLVFFGAGLLDVVLRGGASPSVAWWWFLPGAAYTIWRQGGTHDACAVCSGRSLIPPDSPVGAKLIAEHKSE